MDIYNDKIKPLFQSTGLPDYELEEKIGLPRSVIYKWERAKSKSYKKYIAEIASFFELSMDYFSENEQKNKPTTNRSELNPLARESLDIIDALPEHLQQVALAQLRALLVAADIDDNK